MGPVADRGGVAVFGPVGRDLVLVADELPEPGTAAPVHSRIEVLGGKGANQAVAFARLGMRVALVGAVGDDRVGDVVLVQARRDGIDVSRVVRRTGTATPLIVELLDRNHQWRYLQHDTAALTEADVAAAADVVARSSSVVVQLQQPAHVALAAATLARQAGCRVVIDGAPPPEYRDAFLETANVVRADGHEAELLAERAIRGVDDAVRAGRELLWPGPRLVALAVEGEGNVFVWPEGHAFLPLGDARVVDTTGAGDAFVAALTTALDLGRPPEEAGRWAVAAAALSVGYVGGRPRMTAETLGVALSAMGGTRDGSLHEQARPAAG